MAPLRRRVSVAVGLAETHFARRNGLCTRCQRIRKEHFVRASSYCPSMFCIAAASAFTAGPPSPD
jgi:hypothetical protein